VVSLAILLVGCTRSDQPSRPSPRVSGVSSPSSPSASALPAIPSSSGRSLGPNQPPIVWIGGKLTELKPDRLELKEPFGSVVTVRLLGRYASAFFRVSGGAWKPANPRAYATAGTKACIETLMNGGTLLALRVFLGADCGPSMG